MFGLVYCVMLGWSRRPGTNDGIRFGLFCAAWLNEKAGGMRSNLVCHVASVASDDGSINDPTMYSLWGSAARMILQHLRCMKAFLFCVLCVHVAVPVLGFNLCMLPMM